MKKNYVVLSALGLVALSACNSEVKSTPPAQASTDKVVSKDGYGEKKLGNVIAVERTYPMNLDDCAKNFAVKKVEDSQSVIVECTVEFLPRVHSDERANLVTQREDLNARKYDNQYVYVNVGENGYTISASVLAEEADSVTFDSMKTAFDLAIKDYAPEGTVSIVVYTLQK